MARPARRQPDDRIHTHQLGSFTPGGVGKRLVVNLRQGVPRNACIEKYRGEDSLRCWASHSWLTDEAAEFVFANATWQERSNSFMWNDDVQVRETKRG